MNQETETALEPLSVLLPPAHILLDAEAQTWEEAVRLAGGLLIRTEAVTPGYVDAMIAVRNELGPYIVIAPGVALPHARPEHGVRRNAFSFVRLRTPVAFGNPDNDPVTLVIALAAVDKHRHIRALQTVATLLDEPKYLEGLRQAKDPEEVRALIERVEADTAPAGGDVV